MYNKLIIYFTRLMSTTTTKHNVKITTTTIFTKLINTTTNILIKLQQQIHQLQQIQHNVRRFVFRI